MLTPHAANFFEGGKRECNDRCKTNVGGYKGK